MSISSSGKIYTVGIIEGNHAAANKNATILLPDDTPANLHSDSASVADPQSSSDATIGAFSDGSAIERHDGITLDHITPGGPADRAGIKSGDVILAIDNHYLFTGEELDAEIKRYQPGTRVIVRYRRYSTIYETSLAMGSVSRK